MIRFILKRKYHNEYNDMRSSHHETILCDVPELEAAMCRGGSSENGYDVTEFVGMSIEDAPQKAVEAGEQQATHAEMPFLQDVKE